MTIRIVKAKPICYLVLQYKLYNSSSRNTVSWSKTKPLSLKQRSYPYGYIKQVKRPN